MESRNPLHDTRISVDSFLKTEIKLEPDDYEDEPIDYNTPSLNYPSYTVKPEQNFDSDISFSELDSSEDEDEDQEKYVRVKKKSSPPGSKFRPLPRHKKQSYICPHCNIIIDSKQKLSSHLKVHREASHECPNCNKKFKSRKNLEKHECAICRVCGDKFSTQSELKVHMKHNHVELAAQIYYVQCDFCGKKLKTKTYLIHHIRAEHLKDNIHMLLCTLCGGNFGNKFILNQHMKIAHSSMISCKLCGKKVKPLCMPYHIKQVHAAERNFLCTVCSAAFKTRDNLNDHLKVHDKKFLCKVCGKSYAHKYQLGQHMILHDDPNAFTCTICDRKFSTRSYLRRHLKAHEDGNVKCRICGNDVNTLSLHYHMKNAHPNERFSCTKCSAGSFANQREFNEHLRTHEEERVKADREEKEREQLVLDEAKKIELEKKTLEQQLINKQLQEQKLVQKKVKQAAKSNFSYESRPQPSLPPPPAPQPHQQYPSNYPAYNQAIFDVDQQQRYYGNEMKMANPFEHHDQEMQQNSMYADNQSFFESRNNANDNDDKEVNEKFDPNKFNAPTQGTFDGKYSDNDDNNDDRFYGIYNLI